MWAYIMGRSKMIGYQQLKGAAAQSPQGHSLVVRHPAKFALNICMLSWLQLLRLLTFCLLSVDPAFSGRRLCSLGLCSQAV
jgi:hypothetical protein